MCPCECARDDMHAQKRTRVHASIHACMYMCAHECTLLHTRKWVRHVIAVIAIIVPHRHHRDYRALTCLCQRMARTTTTTLRQFPGEQEQKYTPGPVP
eukprot:4144750-Lingulodinium_polyedra.AAC.1